MNSRNNARQNNKITKGNLPERTMQLTAKKQKSSSCDDGNSRKGPHVRDNQPFVVNFEMCPFFIGQETSTVARLEENPQTDKTWEMPCDKITLCFWSTA